MLTFTPAFRVTENEETGDITIHIAQGVVGLQLDSLTRHGVDTLAIRDLTYDERCDLIAWSAAQGRPLGDTARQVVGQQVWPSRAMPHAEADALAVAEALWQRDRAPAFDAELVEEGRAIRAGELAYD